MATEKPSERAKRLSAEGRCIVCSQTDSDLKRGLCSADYQKWRNASKKVKPHEQEEWEAMLVEQGVLLPDQRFRSDPFKEALRLLREKSEEYNAERDQVVFWLHRH
jgi:hypothetical protein